MYTINEFSKQTGFSIRMLRYLEEIEVLIPNRDKNNYRVYVDTQISHAKRIKKLQTFGIQLKEIEQLSGIENSAKIKILKNVLDREVEIAELKSNSITYLKDLIDFLKIDNNTIDDFFKWQKEVPQELNIIGNDQVIKRKAYRIPILRNIYEDHLVTNTSIELIATDLINFNTWFDNASYDPQVFSVFQNTSYIFGNEISEDFINGFELAWNKFLPKVGFEEIKEFSKTDVGQLMGPHDVLIRTIFKYIDSDIEAEILIPYAPVYTMSHLK